jgi:uncharacterized protein (UPF0333 family)
MYIKNKRGQSTVEYILLVTAVVAVIILFLTNQNQGGFVQTLNSTLNQASSDMSTEETTLSDSHAATSPVDTPPPVSINVNY